MSINAVSLADYLHISSVSGGVQVRVSLHTACANATIGLGPKGLLQLCLPPTAADDLGTVMQQSEVLAAIHKLMHQKKSGQLLYMLGCFFHSIQRLLCEHRMKAVMLRVHEATQQIVLTFAVAVFRDGGFLFVDQQGQMFIVSSLFLLCHLALAPRALCIPPWYCG